MNHCVYISLGSNFENALELTGMALRKIGRLFKIEKISPVFYTEPQDDPAQPWFVNMTAKLTPEWNIEPARLLEKLHEIEDALGRRRDPNRRYGPRSMDLDLLHFDGIRSEDKKCRLPHPAMLKRAFVLVPLTVMEPLLIIEGRPAASWLGDLSWRLAGNRIFQKQ